MNTLVPLVRKPTPLAGGIMAPPLLENKGKTDY